MSAPLVDAGGHSLSLRLQDTAVALHADHHRMAQVLSNLVNNAAKYTPRGGHIEVIGEVRGEEVVITIKDNGIGIAPQFLPSVFDMYAQAQAAGDMAQGGFGVGLHLVRQLVQLHGRRVTADSAGVGQGASFTVWLPSPAQAAPAIAVPAQPQAPEPMSGLRILVVDDNVDAAETLGALLEFSGHEVQLAHDGAAALSKVTESLPHAVFLDIGLPDMSGFDAALALRAIDGMAQAKIIALTGRATDADKQRATAAGFDLHLTKPVDFSQVQLALNGAASIAYPART